MRRPSESHPACRRRASPPSTPFCFLLHLFFSIQPRPTRRRSNALPWRRSDCLQQQESLRNHDFVWSDWRTRDVLASPESRGPTFVGDDEPLVSVLRQDVRSGTRTRSKSTSETRTGFFLTQPKQVDLCSQHTRPSVDSVPQRTSLLRTCPDTRTQITSPSVRPPSPPQVYDLWCKRVLRQSVGCVCGCMGHPAAHRMIYQPHPHLHPSRSHLEFPANSRSAGLQRHPTKPRRHFKCAVRLKRDQAKVRLPWRWRGMDQR